MGDFGEMLPQRITREKMLEEGKFPFHMAKKGLGT